MTEKQNKIWADDRLGRRSDAKFLMTFLRNRSEELVKRREQRSFVINLDSEWGGGKTFFLKHMRDHLSEDGHIAVYVNAWQDDFADDPLVAVMAAIDEEVAKHVEKKPPGARVVNSAWRVAKKSAGKVAGHLAFGLLKRGASALITASATEAIGAAVAEAKVAIAEDDVKGAAEGVASAATEAVEAALEGRAEEAIADFNAARESIEAFKKNLGVFIDTLEQKNVPAPFIILLDELDRCRPPYAIATLERIKHLFETPRVVFLIATDSGQLIHSIGAIYGAGFDSRRYLKRFFDHVYSFEKPVIYWFIDNLLETMPLDKTKLSTPWDISPRDLLISFFDAMGMDLRAVEHVYGMLRTIVTVWSEKLPVELVLVLPLLMAYYFDRNSISERANIRETVFQRAPAWSLVDSRGSSGDDIDCFALADLLYRSASIGLAKASESAMSDDLAATWVKSRFQEEMKFAKDSGQLSILLDYPRLVRQAGRLDEQLLPDLGAASSEAQSTLQS